MDNTEKLLSVRARYQGSKSPPDQLAVPRQAQQCGNPPSSPLKITTPAGSKAPYRGAARHFLQDLDDLLAVEQDTSQAMQQAEQALSRLKVTCPSKSMRSTSIDHGRLNSTQDIMTSSRRHAQSRSRRSWMEGSQICESQDADAGYVSEVATSGSESPDTRKKQEKTPSRSPSFARSSSKLKRLLKTSRKGTYDIAVASPTTERSASTRKVARGQCHVQVGLYRQLPDSDVTHITSSNSPISRRRSGRLDSNEQSDSVFASEDDCSPACDALARKRVTSSKKASTTSSLTTSDSSGPAAACRVKDTSRQHCTTLTVRFAPRRQSGGQGLSPVKTPPMPAPALRSRSKTDASKSPTKSVRVVIEPCFDERKVGKQEQRTLSSASSVSISRGSSVTSPMTSSTCTSTPPSSRGSSSISTAPSSRSASTTSSTSTAPPSRSSSLTSFSTSSASGLVGRTYTHRTTTTVYQIEAYDYEF